MRWRVARYPGRAVVDAYAVDADLDAVARRAEIESDDAEAALDEFVEVVEAKGEVGDDYPRIPRSADSTCSAARDRDRAGYCRARPAAPHLGRHFDGPGHVTMRGIGDGRHQEADDRNDAGFQLARRPMRPVIEFADRGLDAQNRFRRHAIRAALSGSRPCGRAAASVATCEMRGRVAISGPPRRNRKARTGQAIRPRQSRPPNKCNHLVNRSISRAVGAQSAFIPETTNCR